MKEITDTDWSDSVKIKYFADLVYAMENCRECEDIYLSFSDVEVEYIKLVSRYNE